MLNASWQACNPVGKLGISSSLEDTGQRTLPSAALARHCVGHQDFCIVTLYGSGYQGRGCPKQASPARLPVCGGQWDPHWTVPTWHMLPVCPHRHLLSDSSPHVHIPSAVQGPQHLVIGATMDANQGDPSRLQTRRDSPQRRTRGLGSRRHTRNCSRPAQHAAGWSRSHSRRGKVEVAPWCSALGDPHNVPQTRLWDTVPDNFSWRQRGRVVWIRSD